MQTMWIVLAVVVVASVVLAALYAQHRRTESPGMHHRDESVDEAHGT